MISQTRTTLAAVPVGARVIVCWWRERGPGTVVQQTAHSTRVRHDRPLPRGFRDLASWGTPVADGHYDGYADRCEAELLPMQTDDNAPDE